MARRSTRLPKVKEPKTDIRVAKDFFNAYVAHQFDGTHSAYIGLETLPEYPNLSDVIPSAGAYQTLCARGHFAERTQLVWHGQFMDAFFGTPTGCRAASQVWDALYPVFAASTGTYAQLDQYRANAGWHVGVLPEDGLRFMDYTVTFYPHAEAPSTGGFWNAYQPMCGARVFRQEFAHHPAVKMMRGIMQRRIARRDEMCEALGLARDLFDLGDEHNYSLLSLSRCVPGLLDLLHAFGVQKYRIDQGVAPMRGRDTMTFAKIRNAIPEFASRWGHASTVLLKVAQARAIQKVDEVSAHGYIGSNRAHMQKLFNAAWDHTLAAEQGT